MILLVLDEGLRSGGSSRGSRRRTRLLSDGNLRLYGVLAHGGVNRGQGNHTGFEEARLLWNMAVDANVMSA